MKYVFLSLHSGISFRGVETYVHELGNELINQGQHVEVIQSGPMLNNSLYETKVVSNKRFTLEALSLLDSSVDVLIPMNGRMQSLLAKFWTLMHRKKLIISGQSGPGRDERWNLYCFPDLFVATTQHVANWARKVNPLVKTITILGGVDLDKFNPSGKSLPTNLSHPIILYAAALVPIKRQELAIKAVATLRQGSLLLAGKGPEFDKSKALAEQLLPGRYKIMSCPPEKMPEVYRIADVFTYPTSSWEAAGLVLYEAMASGLPVVANDDPIRREIVGGAGIFIDPLDTEGYAQALELAFKKDWEDIPHQRAAKYTWANVAKGYQVGIMN